MHAAAQARALKQYYEKNEERMRPGNSITPEAGAASLEVCSNPSRKLNYTIIKCSSFSSTYYPENILEDKPKEQSSRWSSETNTPPQFLILKLQRVAIVQNIKFGKFEKTHVCNLRKFKVYGGLSENTMVELLESGLKNDVNPETFALKHEINGIDFPCKYIKIVPIQSWGPSFNFSIWYVELTGIDNHEVVKPCMAKFNKYREREAIRLCLKHLRDHNHLEAFESLQKKTKIQLEHPLITNLHRVLVENGDYEGAEKFLQEAADQDMFHDFIAQQDYKACWVSIYSDLFHSHDVSVRPGMRGGHQMCIDPITETVYIHGGWDGIEDLADFWSYHVPSDTWTCLSSNTEQEGGPSRRSCHKMVLDPENRHIFTLGRYLDSSTPNRCTMKSDFYMYDIESGKWTLITDDTAAMGGPQLLFDHQICMDVNKRTIYVFGGRILSRPPGRGIETLNADLLPTVFGPVGGNGTPGEQQRPIDASLRRRNVDPTVNLSGPPNPREENFDDDPGELLDVLARRHPLPASNPPEEQSSSSPSSASSELTYSGLYSYHIPTNTWSLLRCDIATPKPNKLTVRSRVGHSMLFHPGLRKLYIFAGQRAKEYLNDFFSYDVDADEIEIISDGSRRFGQGSPTAGFTQRATIDPDLNEIYVFSGLSKDKEKRDENVQNSFWVFDILRKQWSCVYKNEAASSEQNWSDIHSSEPCPRFAHQLVYDSLNKLHYLFGGNPGRSKEPKLRLNDLWQLRLVRPSKSDLLRECKLMLRKQRFEELAISDSIQALQYLQTCLSELINHKDPQQTKEFQALTLLLFSSQDVSSNDGSSEDSQDVDDILAEDEDELALKRSQLFDKLIRYFPVGMTQPDLNLVDLLPLC